jgi:hypothetical protein
LLKVSVEVLVPHVLRQWESVRHITGADDQVELEREVLRELALVIRDYDMMGTELLDVLRLVRRRGEGVDLGAESIGEEDGVVTLYDNER